MGSMAWWPPTLLEDHVALVPQGDHVAHVGPQDDPVAGLDNDFVGVARQRDPAADHVDHPGAQLLR